MKRRGNRRRGGGNKSGGVEKLTDGLIQILKEYPDFKFCDTHIHLNLIYQRKTTKLEKKSLDKLKVLKNVMFSKKERSQKEIMDRLYAVITIFCEPASLSPSFSTFKELVVEDDQLQVYCAFGIHPHEAKSYNEVLEKNLKVFVQEKRCVALGEIGLDFHYDNSPRDVQKKVFIQQLIIAQEMKKPVIIHSREAEQETVDILKKYLPKDWKIHVHCYTSDKKEFAKALLDHFPNLYIGFTGILTYGSTRETLQKVAEIIPLNRILLESDAPYLPVRNRKYLKGGGKIESNCCNIPFVGLKLAEIKKVKYVELMQQILKNTKEMYSI